MIARLTGVSSCSAAVDGHTEAGGALSETWRKMNTVEVREVSLAEDDSLEWLVKLDGDLHKALLALHVKTGDLGHVLLWLRPDLVA